MSLTYRQARDDMLKLITDAWTTANPTYPMVYDDLGEPQIPKTELPWCRVTIKHNQGEQETLGSPMGGRLFYRDGLLTVQIFAPRGQGLTVGYDLAKVAADAFEGQASANGVWFRTVRLREVGPDGNWFQINVIAEFQYSEAK